MGTVAGNIGSDFANLLDMNKTKKAAYEVIIDPGLCIKCEQCIGACIPGAIDRDNDNIYYNPDKCTRCGLCAEACPVDAIKINR